MENKVKITLCLKPETAKQLKNYAELQGISASSVVQLMLKKAFREKKAI